MAEESVPGPKIQVPQSPTAMSAYEQWMRSTGVPIHRGYFVSDLRMLELRPWPERECNAACSMSPPGSNPSPCSRRGTSTWLLAGLRIGCRADCRRE